MARMNERGRIKFWEKQIRSANKTYENWSKKFKTKRLEEYYLGDQWSGLTEEEARSRYVINMVFSSIETNKPSLVFYRPQVRIQPRPGRASTFGSGVEERAKLSEDVVQTFMDDPDVDFMGETSLALHEAHFRFGVVEVGYTADWIDNPNAGKPIMKDAEDGKEPTPITDSSGQQIPEPDQIVDRESLYVKRIPAETFRVSMSSRNRLSTNDWVGYYEWHYVEDVKANKEYKNTSGLKATGTIRQDLRDSDEFGDTDRHYGMVKLWKVWDLRSGTRHVRADGHDKFLLEGRPFKFLPFAAIKFHEALDEFYPIPPVYQWLHPQDEVNEVRESQRAHRQRFYRRYTYQKGSIDPLELEKLETGGDGVYAESNTPEPLKPIQDAPMGADVWRHLDESKQDFLQVSGITHEQRGIAESETATQANIIDVRSRLREASSRTKVAEWLSNIARLILMSVRENMALSFWVKRQVDPFSADAGAVQSVVEQWQQIKAQDIGDLDLDIFIELASMSPVTEEAHRNSWNQVLALLSNPTTLMIISQSEAILRKTLSLYGIRAENEIREIKRVAQELLRMAAMSAAAGATPSPGGGGGTAPRPPGPADLAALGRGGIQ